MLRRRGRWLMFEEIIKRVEYYKKLGLNPLALATGCAVKVDLLRVVYPALKTIRDELKNSRFFIAPREDALVLPGCADEVHRSIYPLGVDIDVENSLKRHKKLYSVTVVQVYQRYADSPEGFINRVLPVYRGLAKSGLEIVVGKGHSIITPFPEDEFALFDFISPSTKLEGFTAINNDTIHIIDPSQEPGDFKQVSGALSNALNDIFVLGVYKDLRIAPVVNAPTEELLGKLLKNVDLYSKQYGIKIIDVIQPKKGRLLMGATVIGYTDRAPPLFEDKVKKGMKLIITRPMGELAPLNLYLSCVIDESLVKDLEKQGIDVKYIEKIKDSVVELISKPNIHAAEVVYKYLPPSKEEYKPDEHIAVTTDVTGPGIFVVKELAERTNSKIRLYSVPLLYPEISEIATKLYVIPNATSGTNGPFIIIAPSEISEDIVRDLKSRGLEPAVIGEVVDLGEPEVEAPKSLEKFVADKKILSQFKLV
ncbi:MAG: SelD-related putative sulfur metabolism protein [Ignisphaera sp.]